jgi:hypothetical protein
MIDPLRSDGSRNSQAGPGREAGLRVQWPKHTQNKAKSQGGLPGSSIFRSDASHGSPAGRLMIKWELENDSRQPKDLLKNGQSDSLKKSQLPLSQGMLKRWNDHNGVDDGVRITLHFCILCNKTFLGHTAPLKHFIMSADFTESHKWSHERLSEGCW